MVSLWFHPNPKYDFLSPGEDEERKEKTADPVIIAFLACKSGQKTPADWVSSAITFNPAKSADPASRAGPPRSTRSNPVNGPI